MNIPEPIKDKNVVISVSALVAVLVFVWNSSGSVSEIKTKVSHQETQATETRSGLRRIEAEIKEMNTRLSNIEGYLKARQKDQ